MAPGPNRSLPFPVIKVLLEHSRTHLCIIVYGCLMEELRSCGKNCLAHNAETICYLALHRKEMLSPGLEKNIILTICLSS